VLMAWLVRRSRSVIQTASQALPASDSPRHLLDACRQQMGIKRRVRLKLSATASTPAVSGLWRPVILIPQPLADKLSALQLRAVLALGLVGIVESKSALAQRIKRLLEGPVPKSAKLGILRLTIVAVVGALLLPMARGERKPTNRATHSVSRPSANPVAIETEV